MRREVPRDARLPEAPAARDRRRVAGAAWATRTSPAASTSTATTTARCRPAPSCARARPTRASRRRCPGCRRARRRQPPTATRCSAWPIPGPRGAAGRGRGLPQRGLRGRRAGGDHRLPQLRQPRGTRAPSGSFREGVRGVGDACRGLGRLSRARASRCRWCRATSASTTRAPSGRSVAPSPIVACVGVVDDYARCRSLRFKDAGDRDLPGGSAGGRTRRQPLPRRGLSGRPAGGARRWTSRRSRGEMPRRARRWCARASPAAVHDISDGGLAVCPRRDGGRASRGRRGAGRADRRSRPTWPA